MTIAHVIYRLAHSYPGRVVALAKDMGIGEKVLQNKLNVNCESHDLGVKRELEMLLDFTDGNLAIAEYFAEKVNAVVFQLPDMPDMSDMALLDAFMQIMRELGELSAEFQTSYADGDISDKEFKRISIDIDGVVSKLMTFKAAIKRVKR